MKGAFGFPDESGMAGQESVHDLGVFVGFQAARGIHQHATGFESARGGLQQFELNRG
jgi:hypothetical protein